MRAIVKRAAREGTSERDEQRLARDAADALESVAESSERIEAFTGTALEIVRAIGGAVRRYALTPLYVLFGVALVIAAVPAVVVLWLTGGASAP